MSATFGDYRLLAAIGHGGMAEVFLAVRSDQIEFGVDKLLVIKRLREDLASDGEFITMLIDEARLAAKLNHPNIVQTNEVGQIDGMYFLSMEYLDGQPLHRILHRMRGAGVSTRAVLCTALAEVLAGLDYAHNLEDFAGKALQIVHRDVTPQNVFITYAGVVKVVDFGIAKATGRATETREGVIKGKVAYMAPQQALGMGDLDARADVFSVGVMLYEAAIGERMWKGKDELSILRALVKGEIPSSPKEKDPTVPDELDAICRKALAYEPRDRYSAAEMQAALETFARQEGLLLSRRELGKIVSERFADKRAEVRSVVEARLAQLRGVSTGSIPQISVTEPKSSMSVSMSGRQITPHTHTPAKPVLPSAEKDRTDVTLSTASLIRAGGTRRPRNANALSIAMIVSMLGLIVAIGIGIYRLSPHDQTPPVVDHPAATQEEKIKLVLRASPAAARFRIDDGPLLANPYVAEISRSSTPHTIVAQAPGYRDHVREVRFDRSLTIDLFLEPMARLKPAPGAPATTNEPGAVRGAPAAGGTPE